MMAIGFLVNHPPRSYDFWNPEICSVAKTVSCVPLGCTEIVLRSENLLFGRYLVVDTGHLPVAAAALIESASFIAKTYVIAQDCAQPLAACTTAVLSHSTYRTSVHTKLSAVAHRFLGRLRYVC